MAELPDYPTCSSEYTYEDRGMYVCPECAHEWAVATVAEEADAEPVIIRDASGNELMDCDTVAVIKYLKARVRRG